jgi:Zn-dependent peptidase ImmA (M78 family)
MNMAKPKVSKFSYSTIRAYAEKVGAHYDIYDEHGYADIDGLFEKIGGRIDPDHRHNERSPLIIEEKNSLVLVILEFQSARRARFKKAWAIAHYFLHYLEPGVTSYVKFDQIDEDVLGMQANHFAATLMMPEKYFTAEFNKVKEDEKWDWLLSEIYEISPQAVKVRAEILELT